MKAAKFNIALATMLVAGAAHAGTITHSGSIAQMTTDWEQLISVPKFDDLDGARQLQSVILEVTGVLDVDAGVENQDAGRTFVTLNIDAELALSLDGEQLVMADPTMSQTFLMDAYDLMLDFDGTSGVTLNGMVTEATALETRMRNMTDHLETWIGDGNIELLASATAIASHNGGGNITTLFMTEAGLDWRISYQFQDLRIVPLPGGAGLALAGLTGVLAPRRRRLA